MYFLRKFKAWQERRLKINFLIDLLRNSGVDKCWEYLDFAKNSIDTHDNIVGINLAGDEVKYPIEPYIPLIKKAKKESIMVSVHSGEWGNVYEIWSALDAGADRIGHGIRAVDDDSLLDKLSKESIPLEICPTSNLYTGASQNLSEISKLAKKEINLIINTDDPAIFNTTLEQELKIFKNVAKNYKFKPPLLFTKKHY
jgi:adenosine deaminase|tara:strand:+ start:16983 stop:17576 length:594 start_codon:yes stop_codon:yes gene_type:complete